MLKKNQILFDRNDQSDSVSHVDNLEEVRQIMYQKLCDQEYGSVHLLESKKRVFNKFFDLLEIQNNGLILDPKIINENPDIIDEDMFICGSIIDKKLHIIIDPFTLIINLTDAIRIAMRDDKHKLINILLNRQINISDIQPNIMIMAIRKKQWKLLTTFIDRQFDISVNDYECIMILTTNGQLDMLKHIFSNYTFPDINMIVGKTCFLAMSENQISILEHFFTPEVFESVPDKMHMFFLGAIQYCGHLDVIKFFIKNGINIDENNYEAVKLAYNYNRRHLIDFFCEIDPICINILPGIK